MSYKYDRKQTLTYYPVTDEVRIVQSKVAPSINLSDRKQVKRGCSSNPEESIRCALSRAKKKVKDYARCNKWDFFVTLTLDEKKVPDRYNLDVYKYLSSLFKDYKRKNPDFEILIVPECHKDGAYHFHGFIRGLNRRDIRKNKNRYSEWSHYSDTLGFMTMSRIRSVKKASRYVTKYITKDLENGAIPFGRHRYYSSQGLELATPITRAQYRPFYHRLTWENDYALILELPFEEACRSFLTASEIEYIQNIRNTV